MSEITISILEQVSGFPVFEWEGETSEGNSFTAIFRSGRLRASVTANESDEGLVYESNIEAQRKLSTEEMAEELNSYFEFSVDSESKSASESDSDE